jgi:serine/threonine protein kinase
MTTTTTTMTTHAIKNSHHFDKYVLLEKLGSGGFGNVYRARNKFTQEEVAMKIERDGAIGSTLAHECRILMRLTHLPGVCQIRHYGAAPNILGAKYVILDLCVPISWDSFPVATCLKILHEMCDVLRHVHERDILHNDIKTGNILMDPRTGGGKLCDFGLARVFRHPNTGEHICECGKWPSDGNCTCSSSVPKIGGRKDDLAGIYKIYCLKIVRKTRPEQTTAAAKMPPCLENCSFYECPPYEDLKTEMY